MDPIESPQLFRISYRSLGGIAAATGMNRQASMRHPATNARSISSRSHYPEISLTAMREACAEDRAWAKPRCLTRAFSCFSLDGSTILQATGLPDYPTLGGSRLYQGMRGFHGARTAAMVKGALGQAIHATRMNSVVLK